MRLFHPVALPIPVVFMLAICLVTEQREGVPASLLLGLGCPFILAYCPSLLLCREGQSKSTKKERVKKRNPSTSKHISRVASLEKLKN